MIGRNQNPWIECNLPWLRVAGIPIFRRFSGGGTVYHDHGNSLFSFLMPREVFTRDQHAHLLVRALQRAASSPYADAASSSLRVGPRHDIFWGQTKISGSAYRITRHRAYHHGTMLLGADLTALSMALESPVPEKCRGIGAAVTSVRSPVNNLPLGLDHEQFCAHLVREYCDQFPATFPAMSIVDIHSETSPPHFTNQLGMSAADLAFIHEQRLLLKDSQWTIDKTPPFKLHSPSAGAVSVEGGWITECDDVTLRGKKFEVDLFARLFPQQRLLHQSIPS